MEASDHLMDDRADNLSGGARIIAWSQDSSLTWSAGGPGVGAIVRVASGYEAAAELLAAPAAALVVDLRLLGGKHLGLLEIARSLAVEVLAVGALPIGMTADDLSGVRLIARCDLADALVGPAAPPEPVDQAPASPPIRIAPDGPRQPETEAVEPAGASTPAEPTDQEVQDETAGPLGVVDLPPAVAQALGGATAPSKGAQARRSPTGPGADSPAPARAGNGASVPPAPATDDARGLLTPEELKALLGDDA